MQRDLRLYASGMHRSFVRLAEGALSRQRLDWFYFFKSLCDAIAAYVLSDGRSAGADVLPQPPGDGLSQQNKTTKPTDPI